MTRRLSLTIAAWMIGACATSRAPAPGAAQGAAVAEPPPASAGGETPAAPPQVVVGRQAVVEVISDEVATKLRAFIAAHPDDPRFTPDAMVRLGTHELDRADRALDTDPDAVAAIATRAQATLRDARDRFPAYPRRDVVLYQLAHASELAGDAAGARAAYQELAAITTSSLAPEGWFRLGELAFADGDLPTAIAAYQRVATVPPFATIVDYKLAWSHWRAGDMATAAAAFAAFLERGDADAAILAPEARLYLVLAWVEPDQNGDGVPEPTASGAASASVARALAYLRAHAGPRGRTVAALAANALVDDARYDEAEAILDHLLAGELTPAERVDVEAGLGRVRERRP